MGRAADGKCRGLSQQGEAELCSSALDPWRGCYLVSKGISLTPGGDGDGGSDVLQLEEPGLWFVGLRRGKKMLKIQVWNTHCKSSPLFPSPCSLHRARWVLHHCKLRSPLHHLQRSVGHIGCELTLAHSFACGAALHTAAPVFH